MQKKNNVLNIEEAEYLLCTGLFDNYENDLNYYKILLEQFDLAVEDLIYIEHNMEAIRSAESLNIKVFHYDKDLKDINKLNQFLELNI